MPIDISLVSSNVVITEASGHKKGWKPMSATYEFDASNNLLLTINGQSRSISLTDLTVSGSAPADANAAITALAAVFLNAGGAATTTPPTYSAQAITSAFCDTVSATASERSALLTFTQDIETAGVYGKLVAFYPFVGASEALKRRNMLDPDDTDYAFRLLVSAGAPTSVTKGVSLVQNAVDKYKIQIDPTLIGGQPNIGIGVYFPVPTQAQIYGGHANLTILPYDSGYIWVGLGSPSTGTDIASTNTYKNHFFFQRISSTQIVTYNQSSLLATLARTSSGVPANPIEFWIRSGQGAAGVFSALYLTTLLTPTQYQALHTALQTLMTTLGRTS
jgi:hypothetical protein